MIRAFHCEFCGKTFYSDTECLQHEKEHIKSLKGKEKIIYEYRNQPLERFDYDYVCKRCGNYYMVYGCELECNYRHKDGGCNLYNQWEKFTAIQ